MLGSCIGWLRSRHFTGGIARVNDAITKIAAGDYSHRIENGDEDVELAELIDRFNRLNEKTERLMNELRMVTDNVAHDLRTPLTRISGTLELALTKPRGEADYYEACVNAFEECSRMLSLINTMLEITRTNSLPNSLN